MSDAAKRSNQPIYNSLLAKQKRLSGDERAPKTDYSSRLSHEFAFEDGKRASDFGSRPLFNIERAKTLLDLCEDNQVTKEALHYLIKIVEINVSQKELFELLLLPRNEKEILSLYSLLTRKSPNKIGHGLQKASFESTSGEDNVSSNFKDTIMWDIFTKMNTSNDHETRKLAAYIICLLTYNNFSIQQEVCKRFNFSPIDGIMIFNQIPSQLIVEIYFENGYLTNDNIQPKSSK